MTVLTSPQAVEARPVDSRMSAAAESRGRPIVRYGRRARLHAWAGMFVAVLATVLGWLLGIATSILFRLRTRRPVSR